MLAIRSGPRIYFPPLLGGGVLTWIWSHNAVLLAPGFFAVFGFLISRFPRCRPLAIVLPPMIRPNSRSVAAQIAPATSAIEAPLFYLEAILATNIIFSI